MTKNRKFGPKTKRSAENIENNVRMVLVEAHSSSTYNITTHLMLQVELFSGTCQAISILKNDLHLYRYTLTCVQELQVDDD
mgnify:FL=1